MTDHQRGEVVWYPAMFADYDRPFLEVSDERQPFRDQECIGLALTTSELPEAIAVPEAAWAVGGLPKESAVKPWNPAVLKTADVVGVAGALDRRYVDAAVRSLVSMCGIQNASNTGRGEQRDY